MMADLSAAELRAMRRMNDFIRDIAAGQCGPVELQTRSRHLVEFVDRIGLTGKIKTEDVEKAGG